MSAQKVYYSGTGWYWIDLEHVLGKTEPPDPRHGQPVSVFIQPVLEKTITPGFPGQARKPDLSRWYNRVIWLTAYKDYREGMEAING